jgi:hypothetical protein
MEQRQKNLARHLESIKSRSKLQVTIANANKGLYSKAVIKKLSKDKTAAENLKDNALQLEIAKEHVKKFFKNEKDQTEFLLILNDEFDNGLVLFNRYFLQFEKDYGKKIAGLTPIQLARVFQEFLGIEEQKNLIRDNNQPENQLLQNNDEVVIIPEELKVEELKVEELKDELEIKKDELEMTKDEYQSIKDEYRILIENLMKNESKIEEDYQSIKNSLNIEEEKEYKLIKDKFKKAIEELKAEELELDNNYQSLIDDLSRFIESIDDVNFVNPIIERKERHNNLQIITPRFIDIERDTITEHPGINPIIQYGTISEMPDRDVEEKLKKFITKQIDNAIIISKNNLIKNYSNSIPLSTIKDKLNKEEKIILDKLKSDTSEYKIDSETRAEYANYLKQKYKFLRDDFEKLIESDNQRFINKYFDNIENYIIDNLEEKNDSELIIEGIKQSLEQLKNELGNINELSKINRDIINRMYKDIINKYQLKPSMVVSKRKKIDNPIIERFEKEPTVQYGVITKPFPKSKLPVEVDEFKPEAVQHGTIETPKLIVKRFIQPDEMKLDFADSASFDEFKSIMDDNYNTLLNTVNSYSEIKTRINNLFKLVNTIIERSGVINKYEKKNIKKMYEEYKKSLLKDLEDERDRRKESGNPIGKGLKNFYKFGKYLLNPTRLQNNVVHLKTPAGAEIKKLPKVNVTNKLRDILMLVVKGNNPTQEQYDSLSDSEAEIFDRLIDLSFGFDDPTSELDKKLNKKIDEDLERFELLRGEIMAGNNNPEILQELKLLVLRLIKYGVLSKVEGMDILVLLCST